MGRLGGEGLVRYLVKRVLSFLIVVFLMASSIFVVFFILHPQQDLVPKGASPDLVRHVSASLKLNEPIPAQYVNFMAKTLSGQFFVSTSIWRGVPAGEGIYTPLTKTLELFGAVLVPGLLLGLFLGRLVSGDRENRLSSRLARLISLGLVSVPVMSASLLLTMYVLVNQTTIPFARSIISPFVVSLPIAIGSNILIKRGKERYFETGTNGLDIPLRTSSITKLYIAWIMVVVLLADVLFTYGGLGTIAWESVARRDGTVLMASLFLIIVTIALTNLLLDVASPFVKSWLRTRTGRIGSSKSGSATEPEAFPKEKSVVGGGTQLLLAARDFARKPWGMVAVVVILAFIVMAIIAPLIATVPNPERISSSEPSNFSTGSMNPMPPSLDRSAQTGFIHPLGTNYHGQDVYSLLLYGTSAPLLLMAILVAIALMVGIVAWIAAAFAASLQGAPAMVVGGVSSVISDFIIAVPIFMVFLAISYPAGIDNHGIPFAYSVYVMVPLLVFAVMFGVIRTKMPSLRRLAALHKAATGTRGVVCAILTGSAGSILYVTKFVVLFGFLTILIFQFFIPSPSEVLRTTWVSSTTDAFRTSSAVIGAWWTILPQIVLVSLLVAAVYKILDTSEQVWVRRFGSM